MAGWLVLGLLGLLGAALGAVLLILAHLDNPTIAGWLQRTLARDAGLVLAYDELSVRPFSGLHAANLRIRTPDPYAAHAPDLFVLERADIGWAFWPLLRGEVQVSRLELAGMHLAQVTDETGKTSVDALLEQMDIPEDSAPLSHALQELPVLSVASLDIGEIAVTLVDIEAGQAVARTTLADMCVSGPLATSGAGLDASLRLAPCARNASAASGSASAAASASAALAAEAEAEAVAVADADAGADAVADRAPPAGIQITRERLSGPDAAPVQALTLDLAATLTSPDPQGISITVEGDLTHQSMLPGVTLPRELVRARVDVAFDPAAQQTRVRVPTLSLLGEAITAEVAAELHDREGGAVAPVLQSAKGAIDLERVLAIASQALPQDGDLPDIALPGGRITYALEDVALEPASGLLARGQVQVAADIPAVRVAIGGDRVEVEDARLRVDAHLGSPQEGSLRAEVRVARLAAETGGGERIALAGFEATAEGNDVQIDLDNPLASRGTLALGLGLAQLDTAMDGQTTAVRDMRLDSQVRIDGTTVTASASLPVAALELRQPGQSIALAQVRAQVEATVRGAEHFDVTVTVPWDGITLRGAGGLALSLGAGSVGIRASEMTVDAAAPDQAHGRIRVTSALPRVDVRTPEMATAVRDLALSLDAVLAGTQPPRLAGSLPIGRLEVRDRKSGQRLAHVRGGRLAWQVKNLVLDAEDPLRTKAEITIDAALPRLLLASATSPEDEPGADSGANPGSEIAIEVPEIEAALSLGGARQVHDARLRLVLAAVEADGKRHGAGLVTTLKARAALRQPGVSLDLAVRGPDGPELGARLEARYQRKQRSLVYDLDVLAERLEALEAFLPAEVREAHRLDWKALRLEAKGHGEVREVIRRLRSDMTPVLADDPLLALRGEQSLSVDLTGLDYRGADQALAVPQLAIRFTGRREQGPLEAELDIASERIHVESAGDPIDVVGLAHHLTVASAGPPEHSRVHVQLTTAVERVEQGFIGYPVADAELVARGHVDHLASLRLDELRFDNPAGGTRLRAKAALDRTLPRAPSTNAGTPGGATPAGEPVAATAGAAAAMPDGDALTIPGRQALSLSGTLQQALGTVSLGKGAPRMRGKVVLPFRVESGDLSAFLVAVQAQLEDVHVSLPGEGIAVEGFDGVIPVVVDLAMLPDGEVVLLGGSAKNLYSRTRFTDVHPFLRDRHFLSVKRIEVMGESLGPLAGNLRVARDTVALDQLQLGYRGGNIAGQLVVDYGDERKGGPRVQFRGNITGVQPKGNESEVLDANAAITFVPQTLGLEGRIQMLRIGRAHLLEVLDLIDPYRESVDINRVRLGLQVGYPKFVRLVMKDGFLSVKIELGGVAKLVRIGEIRGIALGPLLSLYVAPLMPAPETKPASETKPTPATEPEPENGPAGGTGATP